MDYVENLKDGAIEKDTVIVFNTIYEDKNIRG